MRVLVLCDAPNSREDDSESASFILRDLGCRVEEVHLDLRDLGSGPIPQKLPNIIVIDTGERIAIANQSKKAVSETPWLAGIPTLLISSVLQLSAIDFTLGFTDFLLSPIVPAELLARIRHLDWRTAEFRSEEIIKIGDLVIDISGCGVRLGGQEIIFTYLEFELLRHLAQNRGRVYSREQLLDILWDSDYRGGTRTVDIHVRRVRAKLGEVHAALIVTMRNVGYKMKSEARG